MEEPDFSVFNSVWSGASVTSFLNLFPDNYDKEIFEFWESRLSGPVGHVVDLACGNGALAWIANDLLNGGDGQSRITGVDAADIDPFRALGRNPDEFPQVRFLGNTPIETLPFDDASVDHVISQYGLEYARLSVAVPEIGRVLTKSGRISLILHDDDSRIVRGCLSHLDAMRLVIGDIRLHDDLLTLLDLSASDDAAMAQSAARDALVERVKLNNIKIRAVQTIARSLGEISGVRWYLDELHQAIKENPDQSIAEKRTKIEETRDALVEHMSRLEALDRATLNIHRLHYLLGLLEDLGFEVTERRCMMYDGDTPVGTVIAAQRRSAGG